jgi:hypothetical protein
MGGKEWDMSLPPGKCKKSWKIVYYDQKIFI